MKTVDELRYHIKRYWESWEVERGRLLKFCDEIEREIAETRIPLPLDMDGVPIRLHDKMEAEDGMTLPVKSIHFTSEDWDDGSWWVNEARFDPKELRHAKPRTIEDVLQEFGDWYAHTKGGCDEDGIIAEYADELRELIENSY